MKLQYGALAKLGMHLPCTEAIDGFESLTFHQDYPLTRVALKVLILVPENSINYPGLMVQILPITHDKTRDKVKVQASRW